MEAVCMKIVEMSIAASWLILAVILLRLFLTKAPKGFRYVLWALVAIRLICPFSIESSFSLVPDTNGFFSVETPEVEMPGQNIGQTPGLNPGQNTTVPGTTPSVPNTNPGNQGTMPEVPGTTPSVPDTAPSVPSAPVVPDVTPSAPVAPDITPDTPAEPITDTVELVNVMPWVWAVGVALMLVYMVISYVRLWNRIKISVPIDEKIYICDEIQSPFIFGVVRPSIYVPSHIEKDQMTYILAHEREHLRCLDHMWKPIGFVLLAVHWFNPLVWVAYVLMCRDLELACDERVIRHMDTSEKRNYSETLLACSSPGHYISACPVAFGEIGIKERIKRVFSYKKPTFWVVATALLLCVMVGVCFMTDPSRAQDPGELETEKESESETDTDSETGSEVDTNSEIETSPETGTEADTDTEDPVDTPVANEKVLYETTADLNHDGIDDLVRTIVYSENQTFDLESPANAAYIQVFAGVGEGKYENAPCYTSDFCSTSHSANGTYCLTEKDDKDYLMYSNMYEQQGEANYEYCVFYFNKDNGNNIVELEKTTKSFATTPFWPQWLFSSRRDNVVPELRYELMETWIRRGTILVALDVDAPVYYSTEDKLCFAHEYYDHVWARTDEDEIEEYKEVYSSQPWQTYLYDLDCFDHVVYLNYMIENEEVSKWFDTYNGETLQRIPGAEAGGLTVNHDVIYYAAGEGADVQAVLKKMIEAMILPRMEASEDRGYTITKYRLEDQPIVQIADNIWLVEYFNGYYAYEGIDGVASMSERLEYEELSSDGMLKFSVEGGDVMEFFYLLIEENGVYRLQYFSSMYWDEFHTH
ncbi:MAG: hypothetical protein J6B96_05680 [Agathobacter sp.]|nr:hypothetical protein [Agathobacter sp.]